MTMLDFLQRGSKEKVYWKYVHNDRDFYGIHDRLLIELDGSWKNPEYKEIKYIARERGFIR